MLPKDGYELVAMMKIAENLNSPVAIRYARGEAGSYPDIEQEKVVYGEPQIINKGEEIAIVSAGHIFEEAYKAYMALRADGYNPTLINMRFIKPLNEKTLTDALKGFKVVATVEEGGSIKGGAGEEVQSALMDNGICTKFLKFGLPDKFIEHGDLQSLRKIAGIDSDSIVTRIKENL